MPFGSAPAVRAKVYGALPAAAFDYPAPTPLADGTQADVSRLKNDGAISIAYMPPATEFAYYMAIGEGIKAEAAKAKVETFMLAPQSGADINGQMGMIQDAITRGVDAIILSTHDEAAAAPLVKQAVEKAFEVKVKNEVKVAKDFRYAWNLFRWKRKSLQGDRGDRVTKFIFKFSN